MQITFESRRLYVAPRKSVLFFARMGDEKIRCYVKQDALIEPARGLREDADVFQRCLLAFDEHRGAIESAAARLIKANELDPDGAVTISGTALALEKEPPLRALGAAERICGHLTRTPSLASGPVSVVAERRLQAHSRRRRLRGDLDGNESTARRKRRKVPD
jgi:Protein of unknown function (DUF1488)